MIKPVEGHDGPYAAPVISPSQTVLPGWIDYNGHMNVAYYTMALDHVLDHVFNDELGIGEAFAARARMGPYALQSHMHYLGEMLEGETFHGRVLLLDHDAKRLHLSVSLISERTGTLAAHCEQLAMNVDLEERRSAPYPDWAQARLAQMLKDHAAAPRPAQIGAAIGIRR